MSLLAPGWVPELARGASDWQLESLASFAAYEECSSLFDQVLWAHHAAAANEVAAAQLGYRCVRFSDPLAAAANHVAAWFGSATEAMSGQWPPRAVTSVQPSLPWSLGQAPPWARLQVARALYRAWVQAAAKDFLSAKAQSREPRWRPPDEIVPMHRIREDGVLQLPDPRWVPDLRVQDAGYL